MQLKVPSISKLFIRSEIPSEAWHVPHRAHKLRRPLHSTSRLSQTNEQDGFRQAHSFGALSLSATLPAASLTHPLRRVYSSLVLHAAGVVRSQRIPDRQTRCAEGLPDAESAGHHHAAASAPEGLGGVQVAAVEDYLGCESPCTLSPSPFLRYLRACENDEC